MQHKIEKSMLYHETRVSNTMTSYIFVGRLDTEKGIDILLEAFVLHQKHYPESILHICGTGQQRGKVEIVADNNPRIIYHGRVWKETIKDLIQSSDYMVMPSTFLETFGLTALEALMLWTPVIGNKKWWCDSFIHPLLHIHTDDTPQAIADLCALFGTIARAEIQKSDFKDRIHDTQQSYTAKAWSDKLSVYHPHETIILMSDYSNKQLGGIETHLDTIQTTLSKHAYHVTLRPSEGKTGKSGKLQRLRHMLGSICNPRPWLRLREKLQANSPVTVWFHSILRHIGRYTLSRLATYKKWKKHIQTFITYHDLGLFHPFPHRVQQVDQLPTAWSLRQWIKAAQSYNPLIILSVMYKYILISLLHTYIHQAIDIHIVPSPFMREIIKKRHPDAHCIILPHFVDMDSEHVR